MIPAHDAALFENGKRSVSSQRDDLLLEGLMLVVTVGKAKTEAGADP
jgi:hypothetical protein